jgi:hypothetical protein
MSNICKSKYCSKCHEPTELETKRYCRKCTAAYNREWRKAHPNRTQLQKFKDNVRHKTNMRIRRGSLIPEPCEVCEDLKVEAHHDDYNQPYNVRWLCFKHHREHHKNERSKR